MDLSNFDTTRAMSRPQKCYLRDPVTGAYLVDEQSNERIWISAYGSDSEKYRQASHAKIDRRNKQALRRGRDAGFVPTADSVQDSFELVASVIHDWHPSLELDGRRLECNFGNALTLMERLRWIFRQLDAFVHEPGNYLGEASNGSSTSREPTSDSSTPSPGTPEGARA